MKQVKVKDVNRKERQVQVLFSIREETCDHIMVGIVGSEGFDDDWPSPSPPQVSMIKDT